MPFLLINKEAGWTSHDVVGYLRKVTRLKKIGHAGTLDPFATGLLIVGIGRDATKRLDEFKNRKKVYRATVHMGAVSDTYDKTGVITQKVTDVKVKKEDIEKVLSGLKGTQEQLPPMYSAKKVGGEKLYTLARKGIEVERKPHTITIENITLLGLNKDEFEIEVTCSPGTYIRTLVHDIGSHLGMGAYCEALHRTDIGEFSVVNATPVKSLSNENWENFCFEIRPLSP